MAETNKLDNGIGSQGDLVSIEDTPSAAVPARGGDSVLNMAHVFEEQLEQMTTWKHQLASQMELLRRDGVKLLEKQKNLAIERKKLAADRDAVTADRAYVQKLHQELADENKKLEEKGQEISRGLAELEKLAGEKEKWAAELEAARAGAQEALAEREKVVEEVKAGEVRLSELRELQQRHEAITRETAEAEKQLAGLRGELEGLTTLRGEVEAKRAEVETKERDLREREEKLAAQDAEVKGQLAGLDGQRREIEELQRAAAQEAESLQAREKEFAETSAAAAAANEEDRAKAQEQIAEAKEALEGLSEARQRQEERWTGLEARAAELAAAEELLDRRVSDIARQEQSLRIGRKEVEEAQLAMLSQQTDLIDAEQKVAARLAEVEATKKQLEAEREIVAKQRAELEKKLDLLEGELADQFEAVAKQTRRLTERKAELDARTAGIERDTESRIEQATAGLRDELQKAQENYAARLKELEEQVQQAQGGTANWSGREQELTQALETARLESEGLKEELARVSEELGTECQARIGQAEILAEQLMRFEKEAAEWQRRLDLAMAEGGSNSAEQLKAAIEAASAAHEEVRQLTAQVEELGASREDLQRRLGAETTRAAELAERLAAVEQQLADAVKQGRSDAAKDDQVKMLEMQRDELASQLFAAQDSLKRQEQEALLAKNVIEGELVMLRAEKREWQSQQAERENQRKAELPANPAELEQLKHLKATTDWHRERLLRQARGLRAYKKQVRETKEMMAKSSDELAKQREQLRSRKENLEQVKRLLEKQEMVMARKLADHNALKTVAAVGIFVIMILGSTFLGVYKFVSPTYRSEALVQLNPPATLQGAELQGWFNRQIEAVKTADVTTAAWKILRAPEEHYSLHDVREGWLASLDKGLSVSVDQANKTLFVRYQGPQAEGVSQVCNALATAYVTPAEVTIGHEPAASPGKLVARAAASSIPAEDHRLMISLSVVAITMFVSLLLVILFRHYVTRQLREIDKMADEGDLADLKGELA